MKECPKGKVLNPKTNRCIKVDGKLYKNMVKEGAKLKNNVLKTNMNDGKNVLVKINGKEYVNTLKSSKKSVKSCEDNKVLNPKTNRCITKDGKVYKTLLKEGVIVTKVPKTSPKPSPIKSKVPKISPIKLKVPKTSPKPSPIKSKVPLPNFKKMETSDLLLYYYSTDSPKTKEKILNVFSDRKAGYEGMEYEDDELITDEDYEFYSNEFSSIFGDLVYDSNFIKNEPVEYIKSPDIKKCFKVDKIPSRTPLKYFTKQLKYLQDKATISQLQALRDYSNLGGERINKKLWKDKIIEDSFDWNMIKNIDELFKNIPPIESNIYVFRFRKELTTSLPENNIFYSKGYVSTTRVNAALKNFLSKKRCCAQIILIPKGSRVIPKETLDLATEFEKEVLLPRNSQFLSCNSEEEIEFYYTKNDYDDNLEKATKISLKTQFFKYIKP